MIVTDPFLQNILGEPFKWLNYPFAAACAIVVILVGNRLGKRKNTVSPSIAG